MPHTTIPSDQSGLRKLRAHPKTWQQYQHLHKDFLQTQELQMQGPQERTVVKETASHC